MDTSNDVRLAVIGLIFVAACFIGIMDIRLAAWLLLKRKVSWVKELIWPSLLFILAFCVFDAFRIEPNCL